MDYEQAKQELLGLPNVNGVGKDAQRERTLRVHVVQQVPEHELDADERVPETVTIDGEEWTTDVIESGELRFEPAVDGPEADASPERERRYDRPVPAGISVAHVDETAGTLGTPPLLTSNGTRVVLTNAHVAANPSASVGDAILQPGPLDGGAEPDDQIGTLHEYAQIWDSEDEISDSALVEVPNDAVQNNNVLDLGSLAGLRGTTDHTGDFFKSGRSSGVTSGQRVGLDLTMTVDYGGNEGSVTFTGIDEFERMTEGGDSGSLYVIFDGEEAYGTHLHFAGDSEDNQSFGIPLEQVMQEHGQLELEHPATGGGGTGDTFIGNHTSHPEVSTAPYGRGDYPQSLWDHPEPDIDTVVNLGDEGLESGDTIDGYLDTYLEPNTRVEVPPGDYQWDRGGLRDVPNSHLVGLGGLGDVVFDHSGASSRVTIELDDGIQIVEGIDVVGEADPDSAGHRVAAHGVDTELIFKRYRTVEGTTPEGGSATNGFYMDSLRDGESFDNGHSGTIRFLWCQLTSYGDNGLYCDGPVVDEDARGQVIVVGGEYRHNNISNVRLGHYGHTVYGTRITATDRDNIPLHDEYNQQRGIRIRQPEPNSAYSWLSASDNLVDQCEFYYPSGAGGSGMFVIADETDETITSGRLLRCRFENHSGVQPIADDHGSLDGQWQAHDVHIYGSGDLSSDLALRGDSVIGSSADEIMEQPWWGSDVLGLSPPSNVRVFDTSTDTVTVQWNEPALGAGTELLHYNVYLDGTKLSEEQPGTTTTTIRSLDPDTQYEVGVSAVSTDGEESTITTIAVTTDDVITETVEIGGGNTYPFVVTAEDADVIVSTLSGLQTALSNSTEGDVVFLEADVEIPTRDDAIVVPPDVTLASDRGVGGAAGARIHKDSFSGFGSGSFYGLVRARANARITGLRVEGNVPTSSTWYDASDLASVDEAVDAGIRVLSDDVEVDNCEVYNVAAPVVNGADNVDVHHCHLHDVRLYDPNDHQNGVSFGIRSEGAPAPEPVYRHNLIEHCRLPFGSTGDGGFVARHNIIRGPILQPTVQVGEGGGTASTIRNITAEEFTSDLTSDQLPNVRVYDVPSESAVVENSHLYNPDAPLDTPTASDTDNAIVQIDSSTGDAMTWDSVTYSGNHYGSTDPPSGVGAFPLGDPNVIGRPDNLSVSEDAPGAVTLDWDAPQNTGAGLERYNVYVDGRIFTEVDAPPTDLTVEAGTEHRFEVTAVDTDEVESFPAGITFTTSVGPPSRPTAFAVVDKSSATITARWEPPSSDGGGLSHYRVLLNNEPVEDVDHAAGQDTYTYTYENLTPDTEYDVSIRAVDVDGRSSNRASLTSRTEPAGADAPARPGLQTRDVSVTRAALEIDVPEDYDTGNTPLSHFNFYRGGAFQRELPGDTDLFVETDLDPRTTYSFAVRAVNDDGFISPAGEAVATTLEPGSNHRGTPIGPGEESCAFGDLDLDVGPSPPRNLRAVDRSHDGFVVRWDAPDTAGSGIDYYNVYVDGLIEDQPDDTESTLTFPDDQIGEDVDIGVEAVDTTGITSDRTTETFTIQ